MDWLRMAAALTLLAAPLGAAGQRPDFSGTWITVSPAEAAGQEQWIRQDAATLATGHASEGDGHSFTYKLDGSETRQVLSSHGDEIVTLSRAAWKGDRLEITQKTTYPDGRKMTSTSIWGLDAEGQLVIESTVQMDGRPPTKGRTVARQKR
jgi:hypothetical protein